MQEDTDRMADRASRLVGWACLIAAAMILFRPDGAIAESVARWNSDRAVRKEIQSNWVSLASSPYVIGSDSIDPVAVELLDYRCVFCRAFHDSATRLFSRNPRLSIAIRHAPRPGDPISRLAAAAAICAAEQGKFADMHSFLLTDERWMRGAEWTQIARQAGVTDVRAFGECLSGPAVERALEVDSVWTVRLRLSGTPAFTSSRGELSYGVPTQAQVNAWSSEPGR